ncbi:ATP-binding protein [Streptomyces sp. NPDC001381]|uniref:ATP-binding protein n=1 Tax=Streptomyces sp. NPDC001381 TaxID=3364567 RepID=UPI00367E5C4E
MNGHSSSLYTPPITTQYRMPLTVGAHSAGHVRRIIRRFLKDWGLEPLTESVELATTELVANVYRHVPDRRCELLLLKQCEGVRVEVMDDHPALPTQPLALDPDSETGRGLFLLGALVGTWGVSPTPGGGKTVWFEC